MLFLPYESFSPCHYYSSYYIMLWLIKIHFKIGFRSCSYLITVPYTVINFDCRKKNALKVMFYLKYSQGKKEEKESELLENKTPAFPHSLSHAKHPSREFICAPLFNSYPSPVRHEGH